MCTHCWAPGLGEGRRMEVFPLDIRYCMQSRVRGIALLVVSTPVTLARALFCLEVCIFGYQNLKQDTYELEGDTHQQGIDPKPQRHIES